MTHDADTAAQLENEAEARRTKLASTLGELRDRLAPGGIGSAALSFARQNGDAMLSNLSSQARGNPLAFFLIGTGAALLLRSTLRGDGYRGGMSIYRDDDAGDLMRRTADPTAGFGYDDDEYRAGRRALPRFSEAADSISGAVRDTVSSASDEISSRAATVRESVNDGIGSLREGYSSATDAVSQRAGELRDRASDLRDRATDVYSDAYDRAADYSQRARSGLSTLASEQPLVLGALGLLAGAALAAMLPRTRMEDEYMGSTAQRLRSEARHTAEDTYERAKTAASRAAEVATEEFTSTFNAGEGEKADATSSGSQGSSGQKASGSSAGQSSSKAGGASGGPTGGVSSPGGTSSSGMSTAAKGISSSSGGARPTESISSVPGVSRT